MVKTTTATPTFEETFDTPPLTTATLQPKTTNGLRTIAEITAALEKELDQEILKKVDSYDYIPWPDAVRLANRIFGVSGRDIELRESRREVVPNDKGELSQGYTSIIRITVYPSDSRPFFQDGLGFSELVFSKEKSGTDRNGNVYYVPSRALIDSSIKGSASRALLRTLVLTGETFGLSLYDKNDEQASTGAVAHTTTTTGQTNGAYTGTTGGRTLSEKQVGVLVQKLRITQEQAASIPFDQGKAALDKLFANEKPWLVAKDLGFEYQSGDRIPIPAGR